MRDTMTTKKQIIHARLLVQIPRTSLDVKYIKFLGLLVPRYTVFFPIQGTKRTKSKSMMSLMCAFYTPVKVLALLQYANTTNGCQYSTNWVDVRVTLT